MIRYLLDTNTLTHPLTKRPNPLVLEALERHAGEVGTSAVCVFEALSGVGFSRPNRAPRYFEELQSAGFPMLSYDPSVAALHAALIARLRRRGVNSDFRDGAIAATARLYELTVVTNNESHFDPFGVDVVNWLR